MGKAKQTQQKKQTSKKIAQKEDISKFVAETQIAQEAPVAEIVAETVPQEVSGATQEVVQVSYPLAPIPSIPAIHIPAPAVAPVVVVEEPTTFVCKRCGRTGCRVGKYKDSVRLELEWCSECAYEIEYQQDRLEPLIQRIFNYWKDVSTFPDLQSKFIEEITKIFKSE